MSKEYKLVSRSGPESARVRVGQVLFGGDRVVLLAGPCAVESREQILEVARAVAAAGAHMLRGGAFKPRTSPYSFRGLGEEGLRLLAAASRETGLPCVTEVLDPRDAPLVAEYADMLQIGARNSQNFPLLSAVGRIGKPVLLKRGLASTLDELLLSAEYIAAEGNRDIVLCERGVRGFDPSTRNVLDLGAVPVLRLCTPLPVIVDPSHATGDARLVPAMARAAVAAGADGVMIEVHPRPEEALSDASQALRPDAFARLAGELCELSRALPRAREVVDRDLAP